MAFHVAKIAKAATGSLLAGSMLMAAMPAAAQYRGDYGRHRDRGVSAGEVIAGALVIGGIAAILSSGNNNRNRDGYYDNRYGDNDRRWGNPRQAVEQCVAAVENQGRRRDNIDVRQINRVEQIRGGYVVTGTVAVDYGRNNGRYGDRYDRYDNGRYDDRYNRGRYDDRGRFNCTVRYGRIDDLDVRGI
jgi:hypothetical protein